MASVSCVALMGANKYGYVFSATRNMFTQTEYSYTELFLEEITFDIGLTDPFICSPIKCSGLFSSHSEM